MAVRIRILIAATTACVTHWVIHLISRDNDAKYSGPDVRLGVHHSCSRWRRSHALPKYWVPSRHEGRGDTARSLIVEGLVKA